MRISNRQVIGGGQPLLLRSVLGIGLYFLAEHLAGDRGDQHAGGVETVLVNHFNPALVDSDWWPARVDELVAGQIDLATALDLSADVGDFVAHVEQALDRGTPCNGIVGVVENAEQLDPALLLQRMLDVAREDLQALGATTI